MQYLAKKRLRKADLTSQEEGKRSPWRFATRIVTSNKEVDAINKSQLIRFARENRKPVLFWQCQPTCTSGDKSFEDYASNMVEGVRGMVQYFVEGAPCMITKNTYMKHGVANGTAGRMHSLTWESLRYAPHFSGDYVPGQLIRVEQPYAINISIPRAKKYNKNFSPCEKMKKQQSSTMIVPMIRVSHDFQVIKYNRKTKQKGVRLRCYTHNVAPTFAVTFHKAQGQTIANVILHLHKHPGRALKRIQFQGLYVALSRVELGSNIRVVFDDINGLNHLYSLKRPQNFDLWVKNYCQRTGRWIQEGMKELRERKVATALSELKHINKLGDVTKNKLIALARVLDVTVEKSSTGALNKEQYGNALFDMWKKQRTAKHVAKKQAVNVCKHSEKKPRKDRLNNASAIVVDNCVRSPCPLWEHKPQMVSRTHDMWIQNVYAEFIKKGLKKVEGRPNVGNYKRIKPHDIIHFKVCDSWMLCCYYHLTQLFASGARIDIGVKSARALCTQLS